MSDARRHGAPARAGAGAGAAQLADVLERVLDKGIVIAGDIQINLLDIELLTIKLRLLVASVGQGARRWASTGGRATRSSRAAAANGGSELEERVRRSRASSASATRDGSRAAASREEERA